MVAVVEHDHSLPPGVGPGDLHGVLDGLGAAVEQRGLLGVVARGQLGEGLGDRHVALVRRDHETGVREVLELGGGPADDGLGAGADARDGDARAEVDQPVAVDVLDDAAARARGEHRQHRPDPRRDRGDTTSLQLLRLRSGDGGDYAALLGKRRKGGHGSSLVIVRVYGMGRTAGGSALAPSPEGVFRTLAFFSRRLGRRPEGGHAPCGRCRGFVLSALDMEQRWARVCAQPRNTVSTGGHPAA